MALITCPECGKRISDKASLCPTCGYPVASGGRSFGGGYEYKSQHTIFGMPLIHIVYGPGPRGILRPAKGFIAIGNIALGVFAIGGIAVGVVSLGGLGLGFVCLAGMAFGIGFGAGGVATGYIALGGVAIGVYAVGGMSIGIHTPFNDPGLRDFIDSLFR